MPRLHVTLTGPEIALVRGLQITMTVVTLLALGVAAWQWQDSREQDATAEHIEMATAKLQASNAQYSYAAAQAGLTLTTAQLVGIKQQIAFANQLSAKRGFSWSGLLSDLEEATPPHVSYSSIHMNYKDATVTLQGATASLQDLNVLVASLNEHRAFGKVTLSSHALEAAKDGKGELPGADGTGMPNVKQVLFDMVAVYHPVKPQ